MPADSAIRRAVKRLLHPILSERTYGMLQAASMARDIRSGVVTEPELEVVRLAAEEGETVLDLGANYGLYSYHLSRAVGPSGTVVAYEPMPTTAGALRRVLRLLRRRNVDVRVRGCSDRADTISFTVPLQASGAPIAGLAHIGARDNRSPGSDAQAGWSKAVQVEADVVAIDDDIGDTREISLIKADIEGGEVLALRGATRTIQRSLPTIVCEINPWFLRGFGFSVEDLADPLFALGYQLYTYSQGSRLEPVTAMTGVGGGNYVFVHPARRERLAPLGVGTQSASTTMPRAELGEHLA